MIDLKTLEFLEDLVSRVTLQAGAEDFADSAQNVINAKQELREEIDIRKRSSEATGQ